jgi:hypothetical protein
MELCLQVRHGEVSDAVYEADTPFPFHSLSTADEDS